MAAAAENGFSDAPKRMTETILPALCLISLSIN